MKTLIVYYSRTGTTKKVAEALVEKFGAEIEEIRDTVDRDGVRGYMRSGRDAMKKRLTKLEPAKVNPSDYDLVIIGTPIWGWNVSAPVRTYLTEQKSNFKQVAFFCTMGGSGDNRAFLEMQDLLGQKPAAVMSATTKEVISGSYSKKMDKFLEELEKIG
jgi:flavodoxin